MILNCYIIDDEPLAIRLLESYVDKTPFLRLQGSCTNAVTALADLSERPVDLLFLDIQMPELNGLEFSKIIGDRCRIIFTTAFEQYAVDSYRVNALDYLLKPIDYPDFLNACEKACQWYELTDNIALGAHLDEGFRQIHSATSRSTQQRSFKWTLAQRLKAT